MIEMPYMVTNKNRPTSDLELNDRPAFNDAADVEKTTQLKRKIPELKEHSTNKYKPDNNETKEVDQRDMIITSPYQVQNMT